MRLKISHRTEYSYDAPLGYALQRVRLTPQSGVAQTVLAWAIEVEGAREELRYVDGFGNETRLLSVEGELHAVAVIATGEVETHATAGVSGPHKGFAPLWLFAARSPMAEPGPRLTALAAEIGPGEELARMHRLMGLVADRVAYRTGATEAGTTAEEALEAGAGVCQDHAHIFIGAARLAGIPARYVSGYLRKDGNQTAAHAWAEAHVGGLGWVGFDPSNRMSPDETYVGIARGRDYRDAGPISGIRLGQASEKLAVHITVEQ